MELIVYKNIPCPVLSMKEPDTFLIFFKDEQKWIFKCSLGYGEIKKDEYTIYYLFNGELYRENRPAIEHSNGKKEWFLNGYRHREDGPAIEYNDGEKRWWVNGKKHREDGPAIEYANGDKSWYKNGKLHREDGPAVEKINGHKEWYIENFKYSEKEFMEKIQEMKKI